MTPRLPMEIWNVILQRLRVILFHEVNRKMERVLQFPEWNPIEDYYCVEGKELVHIWRPYICFCETSWAQDLCEEIQKRIYHHTLDEEDGSYGIFEPEYSDSNTDWSM